MGNAAAGTRISLYTWSASWCGLWTARSNTDPVVMALATPKLTCEVQIPKSRYDAFAIAAMLGEWNLEDHVPRSAA
jgi:hypothetical protein